MATDGVSTIKSGVPSRPLERRRHLGWIALRCAAVGPFRDGSDLGVVQRDVVLELLDAGVFLDEPRRHHAAFVAQRGALLHRARERPDLFIGDQRHWRERVRSVAALAAALKDRRDVLGKGDLRRLPGRCDRDERRQRQRHEPGHTQFFHRWILN